MNKWKEYKVSELINIIGGGTPKTKVSEYWDGDIPWLSVKDFNTDLRKVYDTEKCITRKGLENSSTKLLDEGDIIISARGTVGALAQLGKTMAFNQSCYGLRAKEMTTNDFVYYLLKNMIGNIQQNTHGSVFDTITRDTFDILKVDLPPIQEQKAIAHILSTLDDKIEVNNQINRTLENMAQVIFKQWFVEFEFPNEDGEPYKSSGGEMVESKLGMIPDGWKVGTLNDIGEIIGGGTPSKSKEHFFAENGIPWITPKDLSNNKNKFIDKGALDISEEGLKNSSAKLMPEGAVLFSSRAPIGYIAIAKNPLTTNQGFRSIVPEKLYGSEFVYQLLVSNLEMIESRASGSTFKEISGGELKKIEVVLPEAKVINNFNHIVTNMSKLISINEDSNKELVDIRDSLLPKLMSGEIRVPLDEEGDAS